VDRSEDKASVTFPIHCEYRGGNQALGNHGRHLWVEGGRIGHGEFHLAHSLPLSEVASVEVSDRAVGGDEMGTLVALGALGGGFFKHDSVQVTDVLVRTKDGQEAAWEVEHRGADWVRGKLAGVLHESGVPFYDELLPDQRSDPPPG
jgi:hypothetical protein